MRRDNERGLPTQRFQFWDVTLTYQPKITFGDVRASCVRDVLVYCRDRKCSHHIAINADRWPDHVRLQGLWASGCRCEAAI